MYICIYKYTHIGVIIYIYISLSIHIYIYMGYIGIMENQMETSGIIGII